MTSFNFVLCVWCSDRRRHRIRWHSFMKQHRPSFNSQNMLISSMSVGQMMVLHKLCLLKITALMERYSPSNRSGWNWLVTFPQHALCSGYWGREFPPEKAPWKNPKCIMFLGILWGKLPSPPSSLVSDRVVLEGRNRSSAGTVVLMLSRVVISL